MANTNILFLRPLWACNATFVVQDYDILSKNYHLTTMSYQEGDKLFPLRLIKHLSRHDLCFVWFGGIHAFWALLAARMLRKKVVIVAGGYDAVYMPEIRYGLKYENKGWRRASFAFRHADRVLAVSEWLKTNLNVVSGATHNVTMVTNAVDVSSPLQSAKESKVLTVSNMTWNRIKVKGIEHFLKLAEVVKNVSFILVGGGDEDAMSYLRSIASPNVHFTGQLTHDRVLEMMSRCKIYAQLSYVESFSCTLAEAMFCECVPVVTNRGALPEVAGPDAFYVDYGDIKGTEDAVKRALAVESGAKYRQRIIDLFPLERREQNLRSIINTLIS